MTETTFAMSYPALPGYVPLKCEDCGRSFNDMEEIEVVDRDWRGVSKARCLDGCKATGLGTGSDVESGGAEACVGPDDHGEVEPVSTGVDEETLPHHEQGVEE